MNGWNAIVGLLLVVVACAAGCAERELPSHYGRYGSSRNDSVNGTSLLAALFREYGHEVSVCRRWSANVADYDTLVWAPDDFYPPSAMERIALERWLAERPRTLIYVGRDYDAAVPYWNRVISQADADELPWMLAHRAQVRATYDRQRLATPRQEFARWYIVDREAPPRQVTSLQSDSGWADGIDPAALEIPLETRLLPPTAAAATGMPASPALVFTPDNEPAGSPQTTWSLAEELVRQRTPPDHVEVLLRDGSDTLVMRLRDDSWNGSQILVVVNGSLLLNLPLVNPEHRRLAGRLVAACGSPGRMGLLETYPTILTSGTEEEEKEEQSPGIVPWRILQTWPLGFILLHAVLLGTIVCLAVFPVFGRPQTWQDDSVSDFGRHIEAVGKLLERTRAEDYARARLRDYHRGNE